MMHRVIGEMEFMRKVRVESSAGAGKVPKLG